MKILIGRHCGFCFGVKRAVELAEKQAEHGKVYTYGAIIHNEQVVNELAEKGICPVRSLDELSKGDTLIIRAHGAPPEVFAVCEERGIRVVDATCPFVRRIHGLVAQASAQGKTVLVAGEKDHPEVIGILGHAGKNSAVLENGADAERFPAREDAFLVAQTTLSREQYSEISSVLLGKMPDLAVQDTICDTTRLRQTEARMIAAKADRVFVLGSRMSANTRHLFEICKQYNDRVEMVENSGNFSLAKLQTDDIMGIVAGASTPDCMIMEVIEGMSEQEKATVETIEAEAPAEAVVAEEPAKDPEEVVKEEAKEEVKEVPVSEAECNKEPKKKAEEPKKPEEKAETQEDDNSEFAEAFEKTLTRIHNGQWVTGTVLQIVDGEVYVNVGYKADGIIPKEEFSTDTDIKPEDLFKEGDEIEVEILKVNDGEGNVLLSRKNVESKKIWDKLLDDEDIENKVFEAVGKEVVKGGLIADINGIRAFVPASQVSLKFTDNLKEFVGQPMKLKVLEVDKQRKRIVASQKKVLREEQQAAKHEKWDKLTVGEKVNGIVRRITDFGAFVDIGGIDGLVHITGVGWGRVKHTSDILSIGQEIEVLILNVDADKERVSLGYKQLQPKPWTYADQKYPVGSIVEGKVVRIVPFGAFVALESTIDGLIHISQVGIHRVEKVEDELKVGDIVRCKVLEVNPEAKRISLSRREALIEENPEIAQQLEEEKAERERQHQERMEQRAKEREQQAAANEAKRQAREKSAAEGGERRERSDRRRRNSEDGDYDLPPVESATTSLADLFSAFKDEVE